MYLGGHGQEYYFEEIVIIKGYQSQDKKCGINRWNDCVDEFPTYVLTDNLYDILVTQEAINLTYNYLTKFEW